MAHIREHGTSRKRLFIALALGLTYLVVAAIGSAISGSLTLLAGAGHMMFHNGAIIVGLIATTVAMKAANERFSSGYNKIEALGGYTNALILVVISAMIIFEATSDSHEGHAHADLATFMHLEEVISGDHHALESHHINEDDTEHDDHADDETNEHDTHEAEHHGDHHDGEHRIDPTITAVVASLGLIIHLLGAFVLYGGRNENLCVKGAYLCIFYDVISILIAFAVSASAYFADFHDLDIYGAFFVAFMLFIAALKLMKQSIHQLMDGTPEHIKYADVVSSLENLEHIHNVHDLIIRNLGAGQINISAHLVMSTACVKAGHWEECRDAAGQVLKTEFGVTNYTLQLECADDCDHKHH